MGAHSRAAPIAGPVICVEHLTRTFGRRRGVADIDFEVDSGEIFGFLGPNGAGKSTTIRLLLGLYLRTTGRIELFGLDPAHSAVAVRRRVGYLPGELALYPRLTGRQHLERFARARGLRDLGYQSELVERFAAELDRPVRALSKGNRQKIGIVLAFMHRPELLILDEPTSGLDPLLQDEFATLLRETVAEGRTVFLSSHELDEVQRVVTRLAIIKDGRIVVTDTIDGLRRHAPRTIEFRFAGPVDPAAFEAVDGTRVVTREPDRIVLAVSGPVGRLLQVAAAHDPVDITARPADLEELFLSYYRTDTTVPAHHAR